MTTNDLRCPRCGALAPAGAQWCSLCYASLGGPPAPSAEPVVSGEHAEEDLPETPAPDVRPRGKHARHATPPGVAPASDPDVEQTAAALLAQLAASESGSPLGRYSGLVDTPAKKVGLMVGGAVAAMLFLFIVMAVVGTVL